MNVFFGVAFGRPYVGSLHLTGGAGDIMAKQTKNKLTLSECRRKFVKEYSELLKHHWRVFLCYTPLTGLFAIIAVAILVNGIRYVKWGEIIVSAAMLSACAVAWGALLYAALCVKKMLKAVECGELAIVEDRVTQKFTEERRTGRYSVVTVRFFSLEQHGKCPAGTEVTYMLTDVGDSVYLLLRT